MEVKEVKQSDDASVKKLDINQVKDKLRQLQGENVSYQSVNGLQNQIFQFCDVLTLICEKWGKL